MGTKEEDAEFQRNLQKIRDRALAALGPDGVKGVPDKVSVFAHGVIAEEHGTGGAKVVRITGRADD